MLTLGNRMSMGGLFDLHGGQDPNAFRYQESNRMRPTVVDQEEYKVVSGIQIDGNYKNRHVIVTGASGAIGAEVVKILLDNGAKVVIFGRDKENLAYLKAYNNIKDTRLFKYVLDFSMNPLDLESKFREAVKDLDGKLHSVICWHGLVVPGSIRTLNLKQWDKCMNVNVRSTFMIVSLAIPFLKMSKEENPSVCILSGTAGLVPFPGFTAFSVAKAMLNSFIECAALEMAYHGIRVNGVASSLTSKNLENTYARDPNSKKVSEGSLFLTEEHIPLELHPNTMSELDTTKELKVSEPKDIAETVAWLWSDDASFITGEILKVDGGYTLAGANYMEYEKEMIHLEKNSRKNNQLFVE
jgi:NAD(P)-dependent dehydrogenase (short-subunit alcohol dehydrogenase family)